MRILHLDFAPTILIKLLHIRYHSEPWDNVHGLALRKNAILRDHYGISDILPHLRDPCPNCRWYIESRGGKPGNFEIRKESPS